MTDPLGLAPNDPPMPTGWEPFCMFPTTLPPWPKPIDLPIDKEDERHYLGR